MDLVTDVLAYINTIAIVCIFWLLYEESESQNSSLDSFDFWLEEDNKKRVGSREKSSVKSKNTTAGKKQAANKVNKVKSGKTQKTVHNTAQKRRNKAL